MTTTTALCRVCSLGYHESCDSTAWPGETFYYFPAACSCWADEHNPTRCERCGDPVDGTSACDHGNDLCSDCTRERCACCAAEHADEMRTYFATDGRLP